MPDKAPRTTFDVFDTLLTRAVGDPEAVRLLLGHQLNKTGIISVSAEVFAELRGHAETRSKRGDGGDPRLDRIAKELCRSLAGEEATAAVLERAEVDLERRLSRVVPAGRDLLERIRPDSIGFLSDTPLPTDVVVDMLRAAGLWRDGDVCMCSSELPASKAQGTMFNLAADAFKGAPAGFTHHGDNLRSDVRNARLSGWRAEHVPDGSLNRYETIMERHRDVTGGLSSLMAGASRRARLLETTVDARERALVSVATGVMAPTLTSWLLWIIRRAEEQGCRRIYYMSRDGQVLVDMAQRLEEKLHTGIEHRYLYGGRQASTSLRSLDASFSLHDLREDEVAELLPEHLRGREQWERLMYGDQDELRALLRTDRAQELLRGGTERARQLLVRYLVQEGWSNTGDYALVDVGWRGRIPAALAAAVEGTGTAMPDLLLYFGLERGALDRMPEHLAPHLQAYFFDRSRDEGYVEGVPGLQLMIEMFCVADHAPVTGYSTSADGTIGPIINGEFAEAVEWGLSTVRHAVTTFLDELLLDDDLVDPWTDLRPMLNDLLRAFWTSPTTDEVTAWGAFPVASDEVHSTHYEIAKPVTGQWIAQSVRSRAQRLRTRGAGEPGVGHVWYWPAGVVARSAPGYRAGYRTFARLRREVPGIRRRATWFTNRLRAGR